MFPVGAEGEDAAVGFGLDLLGADGRGRGRDIGRGLHIECGGVERGGVGIVRGEGAGNPAVPGMADFGIDGAEGVEGGVLQIHQAILIQRVVAQKLFELLEL